MKLMMGSVLRQRQTIVVAQLSLSTIGDTPLFSIHRINTYWDRKPPEVSDELTRLFVRNLFEHNQRFRVKTGKKWNCVTLDGFRQAVLDTDAELQNMINEHSKGMGLNQNQLEDIKKIEVDKITLWFDTNYENLIYSIKSKLPWAFILYLKQRLTAWRGNFELTFDQSISEVKEQFNLQID